VKLDATLTPYECACTWWHLTKGKPEKPIDPTRAGTLDAQRLTALPDVDFREIAALDARGEGDPVERAALRHDRNLKRWYKQLGLLVDDVNQQLKARADDKSLAAHDWRRRTTGYRDNLAVRRNECQRLRAEAHVRAQQREGAKRRDLEVAVAKGVTVNELRRLAGEIAKDRLIEAHSAEFCGYLAEAYADAGITLPDRIARRLPKEAA
jgi:hypothetical protein